MKKLIAMLSILCLGLTLSADNLPGIENDDFRQALYKAIDSAIPSLKTARFGKQTIAVLPVKGDTQNLVPERLRNMLTKQGFVCIVEKKKLKHSTGSILKSPTVNAKMISWILRHWSNSGNSKILSCFSAAVFSLCPRIPTASLWSWK